MHRPLDPNTGKPLPVAESSAAGKGSRPPTLAEVETPAKKPVKTSEKSTPKPKAAKTTKKEK